jgi:hypothetical protein
LLNEIEVSPSASDDTNCPKDESRRPAPENLLAVVDRPESTRAADAHKAPDPGLLSPATARHEWLKGGTTMNLDQIDQPDASQMTWPDDQFAEVSLLMPAWQTAHLLDLASSRRLTVGQLLRGLVGTYLAQQSTGPSQ